MPVLLTIDDETEFTSLIQNYFGPRGYQVMMANDGQVGIKLLKETKPDVCLIDLKMPGIHGDEVLKQILAMYPAMKCIMITASEGEAKTRSYLMEIGAYTCFDKPLTSLRDLESKIKEALKS